MRARKLSGIPGTALATKDRVRPILTAEKGQASSEYMLLVSVVVIAVSAAAYGFVPSFGRGVNALSQDVSSILSTGAIGAAGLPHGINAGSPASHDDRPAPSGFDVGGATCQGGRCTSPLDRPDPQHI